MFLAWFQYVLSFLEDFLVDRGMYYKGFSLEELLLVIQNQIVNLGELGQYFVNIEECVLGSWVKDVYGGCYDFLFLFVLELVLICLKEKMLREKVVRRFQCGFVSGNF